ncbi:MAG: peptidylprolyl isomerase [Bdellovibrionota bacterium]
MNKLGFLAFGLVALLGANAHGAVELAKIGSKALTDADVKSLVGAIPEGQKQQINGDVNIKSRMVENLIAEELFVQEGEKTGLAKDKEFQTALERARRQLLANRYLQKNIMPKITDANIRQFFDKNKLRYNQDEVHAFHVLLKTEDEAKEVYTKAKAGEDFEVLAKKYSKDPTSAQNMGDLGFMTRSRMPPQFSEAAFSMKAGEISQPVKTPFGYHIIKMVEKREGKPVKFEDVKDQVRADFQGESINDLIASLKKSNKVVVYEDKVKSMKF